MIHSYYLPECLKLYLLYIDALQNADNSDLLWIKGPLQTTSRIA